MEADAAAVHWEPWVRGMALLSCLSATWLFWHCVRLPRKQLLAKQVTQLAFADAAAFGFEAAVPWAWQNCGLRDGLFKFFLGLSICTELSIAVGTLAVVSRCNWLTRRGVHALVATWLLSITCFGIFYEDGMGYDEVTASCVESRLQVWMQIVCPWAAFIICSVAYLVVVWQARSQSPRSVAATYTRCSRGFMFTFIFCYGLYGLNLIASLNPGGGSSVNRDFGGLLFLCMHGWLTALVYYRQRFRSTNLTVAYQEEPDICFVSDVRTPSVQSDSSVAYSNQQEDEFQSRATEFQDTPC